VVKNKKEWGTGSGRGGQKGTNVAGDIAISEREEQGTREVWCGRARRESKPGERNYGREKGTGEA